MKERIRKKIAPIHVFPGNRIELIYESAFKLMTGMPVVRKKTVLEDVIKREMVLDEAVIFDVEKSDFSNVEDGIGGAFLVSKNE